MAASISLVVSLTAALCLAAEDKSHDIWLTRLEDLVTNRKWMVNETYKLHKVDKKRKSVDLSYTWLQELNEDNMVCQVNVYQKNGGKYAKAPFHVPKTPCCQLMRNNGFVWRCLRDSSNLPESCPILPGDYSLKNYDPDLCEYPKNLPPNGAEDYKVEFTGFSGPEQVFKIVGYGTIKKRIQLD